MNWLKLRTNRPIINPEDPIPAYLRVEQLEERNAPSVVPVGPELRINVSTLNFADSPAIAIDTNGDFVATWQSYGQDGDNNGVFARRYGSDGTPLSGEFQVNTSTFGSQQNPVVGMDASGDFVIAWGSVSGADSSREGVYFQRFAANGSKLGSESLANVTVANIQGLPSIAMEPDGDFVLAWESYGQDGSQYGIVARRFQANGTPKGGEILVNNTTGGQQRDPSVAVAPGGQFAVAWTSADADGYGIYARLYNSAGAPYGNEFAVNTYTMGDQLHPAVAMDSIGQFFVAYDSSQQDDFTTGIYARQFASDGTPQGTEFQLNSTTTGTQQNVAVSADGAGNLVAEWESDSQDGDGWGMYARRFSPNGTAISSELRLNTTTTGDQTKAAVAADASGDFVAAWMGQNTNDQGIYAQRVHAPPVPQVDVQIDNGSGQRSRILNLTATFNTLVSLPSNSVSLLGPSGYVPLAIDTSPSTMTQTIAKITFTGGALDHGSLATGNYNLHFTSSLIYNDNFEDLDGDHDNVPGGDANISFYRLFGDVNADRKVDSIDFNYFRSSYNLTSADPGFLYYFDANADGKIDAIDLTALRGTFNTQLFP